MSIGGNLYTLREASGHTVDSLAHESGVTKSRISEIETGVTKNPGVLTVAKLARALRVTVDEIVKGVDPCQN